MSFRSAIRDAVTLDFETDPILPRPQYPPEPVGLAVRYPDATSEYFAWGHPTGNNIDKASVGDWLADLWRSGDPVLFFNGKFDLTVACEKFNLPMLPWHLIHDAQFLAFLADPHTQHLALKSLAEDLLDWPANERDELNEWIWENRKALIATYGGKISRQAKYGPSAFGAWISKTPGDLAGKYAIGDVDRTYGLFEHLYPLIIENDMEEAYDRERQVLPIFMENERDGMHTDLPSLEKDVPALRESLERADDTLRDLLGVSDLNIDADAQLAEALSEAEVIDDDDWVLTKTGQKSVSKDNLKFEMFQDREIGHLLFYRNRLQTALGTFLEPWVLQARQRDGLISTNWNQVRGGNGGTRTGRPSTYDPNFLNIPKEFKQEFDMPAGNEWGLEPLPYVRKYIKADPDQVFAHRDFDGQEMRVFAHYEDGSLLEAYQNDPDLDPHGWVRDEIEDLVGIVLERTPVKTMNFQGLYGGGAPAAAKKLNCTLAEAREFKRFHDTALPGRKKVNEAIAELVRMGEPIRTWGGRMYFPEPSRIVGGKWQSFLYKLINYLCQGSAADITKEALIRWHNHPRRDARFLVTVYDEVNISVPHQLVVPQMQVLKECMESIELDLLMRSSGKTGATWGTLTNYVDP